MAGLVPAIHGFPYLTATKDVDARHKAGQDEFQAAWTRNMPYRGRLALRIVASTMSAARTLGG